MRPAAARLRPAAALTALLAATAACRGSEPGPTPRVSAPPGVGADRPEGVTLTVAFRDPAAMRRVVASIAQRLLGARASDVPMGDAVGPPLGLSARAARELDFSRPSWLLVTTGGGAVHYLVVLPVTDADRFWRAAATSMKVHGRRDGFAEVSLREVEDGPRVLVAALGADHLVVVDDPAAFAIAGAHVAGELARAQPAADVEVRWFVEGMLGAAGVPRDQIVDLLVSHIAVFLVGPAAAKDVATTAQIARQFRPWFTPLAGMREVALQLTLDARELEARLTLEPGTDPAARALVAQQRPGPPAGADRLPGSAWLVWADRARSDGQRLFDIGLTVSGDDAHPAIVELRALLDDDQLFTGDYTITAHPATVGNGVGASAIAVVADRTRAEAAVLAYCRKYLTPVTGAPAGQHVFETVLPGGRIQDLARLIGPRPRLAIGFTEDQMLISAGAVPEAALTAMIDPQTPRATRLAARRALMAPALGGRRVGFGFASLVDIAGQLVAVSPLEMRRRFGALAGQHDEAGMSLDWGLDARGRYQVGARIPVDHVIRAVGPMFREARLPGPGPGGLGL